MTQRVLVCIVAFNSRQHWPELRAALEAQTYTDFRTIIVDNASRPDQRLSPDELPTGAELLQLENNVGFAKANNLAAEKSDAEFFVTLNPDAFPAADWLERLVAAADASPQTAAFGSLQISALDPDTLDGAGDEYWFGGLPYRSLYNRARNRAPRAGPTFSACAAAALYRRKTFQDLGGFDEDFFCYCEDVDLGFRLRLQGHDVRQAPGAIVRHVGGGTAGARSSFAIFHGTRNRLWTFVRDMPGVWFYLLAPIHAAMTIFIMAWSLFRGTAKPTWRGVAAGLRGWRQVWGKRRLTQKTRTAPDFAIIGAMMFSPLAVISRNPKRRN
ncbi:MAG: glycosyltransferase family 2 protein [Hyphomonadaceae bacterium]|nr:glycosyltransferase family 2 protein [Hyphomonadaceae bacterium]